MKLLSIDIGSTWTKGAAFELTGSTALRLIDRAAHPTTVEDLSRGFGAVSDALSTAGEPAQLFYSSSAKGGLAIAAIGIVPELTAEMARLTACSAGAKLTHSFAYALGAADIASLRASNSDIILLAGGSDGGNSHFPLENARKLAEAQLPATIVFAGNRGVRDEVERILAGKDLVCVENILPMLESPNPEPARAAIRDLFLQRITKGKGLDRIVAATGREPVPTPYALLEYCWRIAEFAPEFGEFLVVDIGGATTDVYSVHEERASAGTVRRGLPEPKVKRTVEGDLGMRVSARSAAAAARRLNLSDGREAEPAFASFVDKVTSAPETLPGNPEEQAFDAALASANLACSVMRHAGRCHEVCTAEGPIAVQLGRDLTKVPQIIGTGGYLAANAAFRPQRSIVRLGADEQGKRILAPRSARYLRDADYLFPLLANLSVAHPAAAVGAGLRALVEDD